MRPLRREQFFYIFALLFCLVVSAQAFDRRLGARPMGMGDAFSALADDVNTINYNPAGLALLNNIQGSIEYANLYPGLDIGSIQENHLVYAQGIQNSMGFGFAWNNRALPDIYTENEFLVGFAFHPGVSLPLWLGLNAKLFYLGYTDSEARASNVYFQDAFEKYQFGLDAGMLYQFPPAADWPTIRLGFNFVDINQPDVGLHAAAKQTFELRTGLGVLGNGWNGAADLVMKDLKAQFHAGVEKCFMQKQWAIRAGFLAGEETALTWTLGGGYAFPLGDARARINYAFHYSFGGILETYGTHRLSLDIEYPWLPSGEKATAEAAISENEILLQKSLPPAKYRRIKNYLFKKIDEYFAATETLARFKQQNRPGSEKAEDYLHQAVGQLIVDEDVLKFLQHLDEAQKQLKTLETTLP